MGSQTLPNAPVGKLFGYKKAFSRNLGLVNEIEQEKLRQATIGIPGLGGVGGIHLVTLARMGFGGFRIADCDTFDLANFNRQYGAFVSTLGLSKTTVMNGFLLDLNPEVRLRSWNSFVDDNNIDDFLNGCDVIVDSLDAWAINARLLLHQRAQQLGIPVIVAGPIGFSAAMIIAKPGSMSFARYLDIDQSDAEHDRFLKFMLALTPNLYQLRYIDRQQVNLREQRGPSIASSVSLCAGFAATEALKLVLNRGKVYGMPHFHYYDPYLNIFKRSYLPFGNKNPMQKLKIFLLKKFM